MTTLAWEDREARGTEHPAAHRLPSSRPQPQTVSVLCSLSVPSAPHLHSGRSGAGGPTGVPVASAGVRLCHIEPVASRPHARATPTPPRGPSRPRRLPFTQTRRSFSLSNLGLLGARGSPRGLSPEGATWEPPDCAAPGRVLPRPRPQGPAVASAVGSATRGRRGHRAGGQGLRRGGDPRTAAAGAPVGAASQPAREGGGAEGGLGAWRGGAGAGGAGAPGSAVGARGGLRAARALRPPAGSAGRAAGCGAAAGGGRGCAGPRGSGHPPRPKRVSSLRR